MLMRGLKSMLGMLERERVSRAWCGVDVAIKRA